MSTRSCRKAQALPQSHRAVKDEAASMLMATAMPFNPFSRSDRAELSDTLGSTLSVTPSFCQGWANARKVDPALVGDWVQRRTVGNNKRSRGDPPMCKAEAVEDEVSVRGLAALKSDIRVKRERAASPVLSQPAKKTKVEQKPPGYYHDLSASRATAESGTAAIGTVRHTRAHGTHPHPGCSTCAHSASSRLGAHGLNKTSPSGRLQHQVPLVSPAPRFVLKSALRRLSPRATSRVTRRVRFSLGLHDEVLAPYLECASSDFTEYGAYIQSEMSGSTEPVFLATSLGKRVQQAKNSTSDPGLSMSATPQFPYGSRSVSSGHLVSSSEAALSSSSGKAPSRQRVLNPTTPQVLRTPSPPAGRQSGSFFSPSFFSPRGSSSSGEEEVEAPLTSSPPTSSRRSAWSSPPPVVSPSPKRARGTSIVTQLERTVPFAPQHNHTILPPVVDMHVPSPRPTSPRNLPPPTDIPPRPRTAPHSSPGPGSKPNTPQPNRPARPTSHTAKVAETVDTGGKLARANDREMPFPPRARTPPGPPGGSRPCTPEPGRPVRPSADVLETAQGQEVGKSSVEDTQVGQNTQNEGGCMDLLPRLCSLRTGHAPSKPCTPEPLRPVRPTENILSSHPRRSELTPPADIPPRPCTPPAGNPPGSRQGTPRPVRPPRPSAGDDLATCALNGFVIGLAALQATDKDAQGRAALPRALPFPPRARTPPSGPPGAGSRPCTPEPGRPVRPTADSVCVGGELGRRPQALERKEPIRGIATSRGAAGAVQAVEVADVGPTGVVPPERTTHECHGASNAPTHLVSNAEGDDAVVLAKLKGLSEVKTEPAEETVMKGPRKRGRQSTGRSSVKSRGKVAVTTIKVEPKGVDLPGPAAANKKGKAAKSRGQIASVAVKVEAIGGDVLEGAATDGAPPAKKRRTTKRGPAKQTKVEDAAAVKVEPEVSNKRTRKKNTMPSEASPAAQNSKPKRTPKKKCVKTVSQQVTGQAAVTTDAPAASLTITASMLSLRVSFSRTSSLQRRESYKGSKHPPRTVAYAPEEMAALENVRWDVTGFECMELSALPWIAGVAQQWFTQDGVEVAGGDALERGK